MVLRFLVRFRDRAHDADHDIGFFQCGRSGEAVAIDGDGVHQGFRRKMRGEGVGQAEHGGEMGAVEARAEQPDGYAGAMAGNGEDKLALIGRAQKMLQLDDILREALRSGVDVAAQGLRRTHVGAWRTAKA